MAGRKRKTVLYWRRVLREAGIDWTEVERLTSDRKGWKEKVAERMEHLEGDRRQCGGCRRWVSRANYARHVRACGRVEAGGGAVGGRDVGVGVGRGGQVRMVTCGGVREGDEGGQPGQAPEGGVPSVGPGRGVDGPMDGWMVLWEAGIDWTEVERLTSDRKVLKEKVAEIIEHLNRWERQKGHGYRWEQGEERLAKNVERGEGELICRYEGCGKVCRNKAISYA